MIKKLCIWPRYPVSEFKRADYPVSRFLKSVGYLVFGFSKGPVFCRRIPGQFDIRFISWIMMCFCTSLNKETNKYANHTPFSSLNIYIYIFLSFILYLWARTFYFIQEYYGLAVKTYYTLLFLVVMYNIYSD